MQCARILLVDDDELMAECLRSVLASMRHEVVAVVNTGEDAVRQAISLKPDIIIMDIRLGGVMDGISALKEIQRVAGDIPAIYLTAHDDDETIEHAMETAPYSCLLKPVKERELRVCIQAALYRNAADRRIRQLDEDLRESAEMHRALVETMADAVILIDNETGCILEVNNTASEMYGYHRDELLNMKNTDLSAEPEETRRISTTTPEGSVIVPVRNHRKKNGEIFPVEISGRFFKFRGRNVHVAAIRDLTLRQRADRTIEQTNRQLRQMCDDMNRKIAELQRWHDVTLDREERIMQLKTEVNELAARLGENPRYEAVRNGNNGK